MLAKFVAAPNVATTNNDTYVSMNTIYVGIDTMHVTILLIHNIEIHTIMSCKYTLDRSSKQLYRSIKKSPSNTEPVMTGFSVSNAAPNLKEHFNFFLLPFATRYVADLHAPTIRILAISYSTY